jgi:hypothetical protein
MDWQRWYDVANSKGKTLGEWLRNTANAAAELAEKRENPRGKQ